MLFFNFASVNFFLATWFMFIFCFRGIEVLLFCSSCDDWIFWFFFSLKISNCSPLKPIFSEGPSFFVRSVCNHGALKLRLHVVALPASLATSWPSEITKNVSRSGFDFFVLVLQSSNSFILNASFNSASVNFFLATWFMFSFCLRGPVILLFCSSCDDWIFWFFLVWKFQTVPRWNLFFQKALHFLYVLFVIMGLWNCACTW